ncbi:MAG: CDP-glycerol glycerophosphotransferase family protein [Candidatus Omnitrophota bacterium]
MKYTTQPDFQDTKKDKPKLNATDALNYSASLVENFGRTELSNGKTLAEILTVEGISFWDVFSAEFAHSHIPTLLASEALPETIIQRIRPDLIRLKYTVKDLICNRRNTYGCSTWPTGQTFLCLGFTNQMYRDVLHPVVARLVLREDCYVVVLSDQYLPGMKPFFSENCKYQTLWQHWNEQVRKQVSELQKSIYHIEADIQLSSFLSRIIPDVDRRLATNFKNLFDRFFRAYLPHIIPHVAVARHILENHRPAMIITSDTADPRTRVYALLCRLMNIPCMDVQFGLAGDEGVEWRFLAADRVAVWGDTSKESMLKQKVSEERIIVTGSPRHDCLVNSSKAEIRLKRAMLRIPEKSALVVMASTYHFKVHDKYSNPELLRSMKRAVFEAADKTEGICLVVKPHPVENVRETRALLGKFRNVIFVERQSDIRELIRVCDAFISFGSTATIDALIAGKLTICPIFPSWVFSDTFRRSGATLVPESSEEIINIFKMIASGSDVNTKARLESARQDFLKHYVYQTDGMAAARVEALALKMVDMNREHG